MKYDTSPGATSTYDINEVSAQGRIPLPVKKKSTKPVSSNRVTRTEATDEKNTVISGCLGNIKQDRIHAR